MSEEELDGIFLMLRQPGTPKGPRLLACGSDVSEVSLIVLSELGRPGGRVGHPEVDGGLLDFLAGLVGPALLADPGGSIREDHRVELGGQGEDVVGSLQLGELLGDLESHDGRGADGDLVSLLGVTERGDQQVPKLSECTLCGAGPVDLELLHVASLGLVGPR